MSKIYMTKGLPASGKSTKAKALVNGSEGSIKRINKDDLRAMVDNGKWSKENEKAILAARDAMIETFIAAGHDVIIDDTNLNPEMEKGVRRKFGAKAEIVILDEFLSVDVDECIRRDKLRTASVGEKVIRDMWDRWESKWIRIDCRKGIKNEYMEKHLYVPQPGSAAAIIVDIDGTLAHHVSRSPYDYSKVSTDEVDDTVRRIVNLHSSDGYEIIILSGREGTPQCRADTEQWLIDNDIYFDELFMRPAGDMRKDAIIKKEIFDKEIRYAYRVHFVLDDRNQVVDMWRNVLGLKTLQVAEGDF